MKNVISVFSLFCLGICGFIVRAQQSTQPDNNKLLEFYQTQQYQAAAQYLKTFYTDTVADPAVLGRLGYCYRMAGDYAEAERYYLQLYRLDSLRISTLLSLAAVNVQRGRYLPAAKYYRQVIAVDTTHAAAYEALSELMRRQGDLELAYAYLERANYLQPSNSDIAYDFSQLCVNIEQYAKADSILQLALNADPDNGLLLLGKLRVAEKLTNYEEMVAIGERLRALGDESQQVLSLLARGYFHMDEFVDCEKTYTHLLTVYKQMGEMDYYYLAMTYKAMKQYEQGLIYMDKVLEIAISPNTAFYYGRKADLHDLANQPSAAASSYLRSFQFETISLHYYSLAVLYDRKLNDSRNALRYYRLYLKQEPTKAEERYRTYVKKRIEELHPSSGQ